MIAIDSQHTVRVPYCKLLDLIRLFLKYDVLNFVNKCVMGRCTENFKSYINIQSHSLWIKAKGFPWCPIFRIGFGSWSVKVKGAQLWNNMHQNINTLRLRQDGRHFADDIFKCIFLNENVSIAIKISLKFVPKGPINNNLALVQIMAWRRPGDKPLSEPMMVSLPTHICVTRP